MEYSTCSDLAMDPPLLIHAAGLGTGGTPAIETINVTLSVVMWKRPSRLLLSRPD